MFQRIIKNFIKLQYLNFCPSSIWFSRLSTDIFNENLTSSTLLELHVTVENFNDCLCLLDGRFSQLHTLHINIADISSSQLTNNKTVNCFVSYLNEIEFVCFFLVFSRKIYLI